MAYHHFSSIRKWLLSRCYSAFERAYETSKRVQHIQSEYISYERASSVQRSCYSMYSMALYTDSALHHASSQIFWSLIEYRFMRFIILSMTTLLGESRLEDWMIANVRTPSQQTQEYHTLVDRSHFVASIMRGAARSTSRAQPRYDEGSYTAHLQLRHNHRANIALTNRKSAWIEAVVIDLRVFQQQWLYPIIFTPNRSTRTNTVMDRTASNLNSKAMAYESVGLVPRSLTRTLSRFQSELAGRSVFLVLPEFRLARQQALASLQYMLCLLCLPWIVSSLCRTFVLEPLVEDWWNTAQPQVFLNVAQEQSALRRLQEMEELLWLDIVIADASTQCPQDLSVQIRKGTIEFIHVYNRISVNTLLHLLTDLLSLTVIACLLTLGKRRLVVLNSWLQELFYSLSDTMKAFSILLLTDLCLGFHSPHGWELIIALLLEHLGYAHNKHVLSCFVSTFPVILDTMFKYWIFRQLNRISPSIVVAYHTMNE